MFITEPKETGALPAPDPGLTVSQRRPDGSVIVELQVRNPVALRNFVLTMLDRAELLGPADLRDDLVAWLRSMAVGEATP